MINKVILKDIASYKQEATLVTDKDVNLIYGLNGSGKSTFSEFLRNPQNVKYAECSISPQLDTTNEEILVYNEQYVYENFYESEMQKGIFSLAKENVEATRAIEKAQKTLRQLDQELQEKEEIFVQQKRTWYNRIKNYENNIWSIKTKYAGGDRVFAYCLSGHIGSKNSLLEFISNRAKPSNKTTSLEVLETELNNLNNASGKPISELPEINLAVQDIENHPLFREVITGNKNSHVAKLIDSLKNEDWVRHGLQYNSPDVCPFCQRPYEDTSIISQLKTYFNDQYDEALSILKSLQTSYKQIADSLQFVSSDNLWHPVLNNLSEEYNSTYKSLIECIDNNLQKMVQKIESPSSIYALTDSTDLCNKVNLVIKRANKQIREFNEKILKKSQEMNKIQSKFWDNLRLEYDILITGYNSDKKTFSTQESDINKIREKYNNEIQLQKSIIETEQSKVVNIQKSIDNINHLLLDMGITDFRVTKCEQEGYYRIIRGEESKTIFKTLSEGERTIISVLYFIETCKGLFEKTETPKKRIIVIDDPVSSLSTMYIFNIGRLLKESFYPVLTKNSSGGFEKKKKCEQLFILTHSMYFFYEMTEMVKEKRHEIQNLFRITKLATGSSVEQMHYEHIQSDYQTYWMIIKNKNEHPALIANCMRNIIEYFFNFIEKRDLNNVFTLPKFKDIKYQAFLRYINRESHSLGQNIFDFKDFNYDIFIDAFESIFKEEGYEEHYKKMMQL